MDEIQKTAKVSENIELSNIQVNVIVNRICIKHINTLK